MANYHNSSAIIYLRYRQILYTELSLPSYLPYSYLKTSYLAHHFQELREALSCFADCMSSLMRLQLVHWFHMSRYSIAVAYV
jgi:hypothetical protein